VFSPPEIVSLALSVVWSTAECVLSFVRRADPARSRAADRSTFLILWGTIVSAVTAGVLLGLTRVGFIPFLYPELAWVGTGFMAVGITLRWTAIYTLKQYFTVNVAIRDDHRVISHGVYRFMRHPSYTGGLLGFLGVGLSFCNWASVAAMMLPVTTALLYRIRVEETALRDSLGAAYADYCRRTARLIPGIY
jgi:protein-S-isoprenylcysteine O-methyltransferase